MMRASSPVSAHRPVAPLLAAAGLMVLFGLYVGLVIEPRLLWQDAPAVFLLDNHFFRGFMERPGGPVEYASAFVSTLLSDPWLGTISLTVLFALVCLAARQLVAAVSGGGGSFLFLLPGAFVVALLGLYSHPVRLCVGLLPVLAASSAYARCTRAAWPWRIGLFVAGSALVCYVAGSLYALYALLCGVVEWRVGRRRAWGLVGLTCAVTVPPVVAYAVANVTLNTALTAAVGPPFRATATEHELAVQWVIRWALVFSFPLIALVAAWRRRRFPSPVASPSRVVGAGMAALAVLGLAARVSFDRVTRAQRRVADAAGRQDWDAVLASARRIPLRRYAEVVAHDVNRALYARGRLLDDLFAHPQSQQAGTLVLDTALFTRAAPMTRSDLFFELGWINGATHMAYEALEMRGEHPRVLERLARAHVLRGQPGAARVVLRCLQRSLLAGGWAKRALAEMERDPTLSSDEQVAARRDLVVTADSVDVESVEGIALSLLTRNPRNRMAFEYLMAHYLLTRQPGKVAAEIGRIKLLDYPTVPGLCQEALVVHQQAGGKSSPELGALAIDPRVVARGREFERRLADCHGDERCAWSRTEAEFGDTYFFYHRFGRVEGRGRGPKAGPSS